MLTYWCIRKTKTARKSRFAFCVVDKAKLIRWRLEQITLQMQFWSRLKGNEERPNLKTISFLPSSEYHSQDSAGFSRFHFPHHWWILLAVSNVHDLSFSTMYEAPPWELWMWIINYLWSRDLREGPGWEVLLALFLTRLLFSDSLATIIASFHYNRYFGEFAT